MTLIELLVTVVVIAAILYVFHMVLSSSQQFVTTTQSRQRANSSAEAIARTIRADLERISRQGFLVIRRESEDDLLICFTQAGRFTSALADEDTPVYATRSAGAVVAYGMADNTHPAYPGKVLLRKQLLLVGTGMSDLPADADGGDSDSGSDPFFGPTGPSISPTLGSIQFTRESKLFDQIYYGFGGEKPFLKSLPTEVRVPATNNLSDVRGLWEVLSPGVEIVDVRWALPDKDTGEPTWARLPVTPTLRPFTHEDPSDWPLALHLTFRLNDPDLPEELQNESTLYHVVAPIGQ
jgi:type II secretory pathway pseudopilin PulG